MAKSPPETFDNKRSALIEAIADIVLADGLNALTLRPLAVRLGTSDRMLLYYFTTKQQLVIDVLGNLSQQLAAMLDAKASTDRLTPADMLTWASTHVLSPEIRPFMRVWLDVTVRAMQGETPFVVIAVEGVAGWMDWLENRLHLASGNERRTAASAILAVLYGATLMDTSHPIYARSAVDVLGAAFRK